MDNHQPDPAVPEVEDDVNEEETDNWPSEMIKLVNQVHDDEWIDVLRRIQTHPHELSAPDGESVLQSACVRYPPVHIVRAIVETSPRTALHRNQDGETPLHAASCSASEDVQILLAQVAPSTVAVQDRYGDCPLHIAARNGATLQVIQELVKAAPRSIALRNHRNVTPFWLLPRSYLAATTLNDILQDEEEGYQEDFELLRLFLRVSYFGMDEDAGANVVNVIEDESESEQDESSKEEETANAALQYRAQNSWMVYAAAATPACPRDVLKFLCRIFQEQALKYNHRGMTPLLLAAQADIVQEPSSWDEAEDGYREPIKVADHNFAQDTEPLPEDAIALQTGDMEHLRRALEECTLRDEEEEETVVGILLEWNPRAAFYPDPNGRFPLTHAVLTGKPWRSVLRPLIAACPRALEVQDATTGLYLFQLSAGYSPELDAVYTMVRSLPWLISALGSLDQHQHLPQVLDDDQEQEDVERNASAKRVRKPRR